MNNTNDFIIKGERTYKHKLGKTLASSLSGFVAGVVVASIFWILLFVYYRIVFAQI